MKYVLDNKDMCSGCTACYSVCPKSCIVIKEDEEGFSYPQIDEKDCIDCKQCLRVCPSLKEKLFITPLVAYAAQNEDEKCRLESSSGGIFFLIATYIMSQGGCVFGVIVDKYGVVRHSLAETIDELRPFCGSKYVQSDIKDIYSQVKIKLSSGKKVLFSGTPCQIAGLKSFLNIDYSNLLTIDFICHGVSSPGVFRWYLKEQTCKKYSEKAFFSNFSFRNKKKGWKDYGMYFFISDKSDVECKELYFKTKRSDPFLRGFIKNLYLRPSCYQCKYRSCYSGSDVTLADFWEVGAINPDFDDNKGTSLLIINTEKGQNVIKQLQMLKMKVPIKCVIRKISYVMQPYNDNRNSFFEAYNLKSYSFNACVNRFCKRTYYEVLKYKMYEILGAGSYYHKIKYYCKRIIK